LLCLLEKPTPTQKELAGELEVEQPTIGRLLDRMEELSLVVRLDVPEDRRAKRVALTAYGEEQARLVASIGQELRDEMFDRISEDELHQAIAVLNDLEAGAAGMTERAALSNRPDGFG
jgi:MarR family transcriptional regulator for hemolysin